VGGGAAMAAKGALLVRLVSLQPQRGCTALRAGRQNKPKQNFKDQAVITVSRQIRDNKEQSATGPERREVKSRERARARGEQLGSSPTGWAAR
jgi:hypothetical protein